MKKPGNLKSLVFIWVAIENVEMNYIGLFSIIFYHLFLNRYENPDNVYLLILQTC